MCYQVGMNRCRSSADSLDPCPCLGQRQSQPGTGTTGASHESERHTQACVRNYMTEGKCSMLGIGPWLPEAGRGTLEEAMPRQTWLVLLRRSTYPRGACRCTLTDMCKRVPRALGPCGACWTHLSSSSTSKKRQFLAYPQL